MAKKVLNRVEKIAVIESMQNLAFYVRHKNLNKTDTTLYLDFQKIINNNFDIHIDNKV